MRLATRVTLVYSVLLLGSTVTLAMSAAPPEVSLNKMNVAVIGVGVLGTSLCRQIRTEFLVSSVTGITKSTARHAQIREQVVGADQADSDQFRLVTPDKLDRRRFENVVFCAPPSGFDDYAAAVKDAVQNIWAGEEKGGVFVFTSSGAV
jgi:hypothetical protein